MNRNPQAQAYEDARARTDIHRHDFVGDGPAQHCSDDTCRAYIPNDPLHPNRFGEAAVPVSA